MPVGNELAYLGLELLALIVIGLARRQIDLQVIEVVALRVVVEQVFVARVEHRLFDLSDEGDVERAAVPADARGVVEAGMPGEMAVLRLEIQVDRRGLRGFPGVAAVSGDAVGPVAEVSLVPDVDQGPIVVYTVRLGVGDAWAISEAWRHSAIERGCFDTR